MAILKERLELLKRDVERRRHTSRRLKKDKRFKIQKVGKHQVFINIRPDVSPQQSGGETGRHSPVKKSDYTFGQRALVSQYNWSRATATACFF
ncbi:MAG: hypothetical protein JRF62_14015 [Deltaproteobacteria bacterium]|nr:hypothetical protein [Deltaproteobacteria bacterium]